MGPFETAVAIVAMCLGYNLLKHIFGPRVKASVGKKKPVEKVENTGNLHEKADDLLKRIKTLEEIMSSDARTGRS